MTAPQDAQSFLGASRDIFPAKDVGANGVALEKVRFQDHGHYQVVACHRIPVGCLNSRSIADIAALKGHHRSVV